MVFIALACTRRHRHNRCSRRRTSFFLAHRRGDLKPIHFRHLYVHQDDCKLVSLHRLNGLSSIYRNRNKVTSFLK
jgi:hypothetical protein